MAAEFGGSRHGALIADVVAHYGTDDRVRAIAVFGSVATGDWHELSDVDLDIVIGDGVVVRPADEVAALYGPRAVIAVVHDDAADVVLDSLEELSIRWHPLSATSPYISASVRVVGGELSDADVAAAGAANRAEVDEQQLLDAVVRDAIGASKMLARGRCWEANAEARASFDLGNRRCALLDQVDPGSAAR